MSQKNWGCSGKMKLNLDEILQKIIDAYKPEKVILFGSSARGNCDAKSDIDLVVVAKSEERFIQRLVKSAKILPYPGLDILIYTPQEIENMLEVENPFIKRVFKEGKVIYEKCR
jgi:predicted nucleotidyltransferase